MHSSTVTAPPRATPFVHGGLALQLRELLRSAITLHAADFGNVQLFQPATGALTIVASQGFDAEFLDYFRVVHDTHTACGRALMAGVVCDVNDVEVDVEFAPHRAAAARAGFRSVRSEPLIGSNEQRLGVLSTHFRVPGGPARVASGPTSICARLAAAMIEEHLRTNENDNPRDPLPAAAERLQQAFASAATRERARSARAFVQRTAGVRVERPILSPDLTDATVTYVRALRAREGSPQSMLKQLKDTLGASHWERVRDLELVNAVVSVAILAYYAEPKARGEQ